MSISDINKKRYKKTLITYSIVSVLCIIFNAVYTHFSYGMVSIHMKYMFLFPLLMGVVPSVPLLISKKNINRVSFNLWNAGCGTFICGCIVVGVINNSGRNTNVFALYFMIGLFLSIVSILILPFYKNRT